VPSAATRIEGDLRDAGFVGSLSEFGRFDYVYHIAAYAAEGLSHFIRGYNYRTNLKASVHLINRRSELIAR
jgi:UDP-glucose 4-epimerase